MSITPPRFFTFVTRLFDGTTPWTPAIFASPDNPLGGSPVGANQARMYSRSAASVGRIPYDKLVRPGNLGALVMARVIGGAGADTDRIEVRSANSAEKVTNELVPEDGLQQTISLTGEWSKPFLLEPRDALAVYHQGLDPDELSGLQLIVRELDQDSLLGWITAKAQASSGNEYAQAVEAVAIDVDDETVTLSTVEVDVLTVRVTATARGTITLPAWASIKPGARIDIIREGDTEGVVKIVPAAGQLINGDADPDDPIFLPLRGALRIVREAQSGEFSATSHGTPPTTTVATGNHAFTYGWPGRRYLRLPDGAGQTATLPAYGTANNVPIGCEVAVVNRSAVSKTIAGAGAEVITGGGATANTYTLAANTSAVVSFDGTQWQLTA
ncbi:hypothetical protein OV203_46605 [Nannocystis sp. ILAH1]|uniref:hypothetical protein n=1 Tax=Nannocystis sp. ILAH1 TaxID=2996789 RepID=UPI002272101C|nr:hypothetical protein [Nannocystis sp. ILAH1]MCY0994686.1 hypothetical protein [Nannocystis sp. ILAH1]